MLAKGLMCLAIMALCFAPLRANIEISKKTCTNIKFDDGYIEEDCGDGVTLKNQEGQVEEVQLFDNDTLSVLTYPNITGCYVVWKNNIPDLTGVQYAKLEKDEEQEEADPEVAAAIRELVPACQNVTVYQLNDIKEDHDVTSRKKRGCYYRWRCYIYYYYIRINRILYRIRRYRCYTYYYCVGK